MKRNYFRVWMNYCKVKIGHASLDEHGNIRGGAAGDQTGREVYIRDYYTFGYNVVIRAFDPNVAENTAKAVEAVLGGRGEAYEKKLFPCVDELL